MEQLDRKWDARRAELSVTNDDNGARLPTLHGALLRLLGALVPLVFFASGQLAAFGTTVLPFVAAGSLYGLAQGGTELYKYNQYREERAQYHRERSRLQGERA